MTRSAFARKKVLKKTKNEGLGRKKFLKILKKHGADKVLFATDSPWSNAKRDIERVKALPVDESMKEDILYNNSIKLLEINPCN